MDISAFKRPFLDVKKLLIGALLSIIPILNFAVVGYGLKCSVPSKKGDLPEWTDFGSLWLKGLAVVIIQIVYMLPSSLLLLGAVFSEGALRVIFSILAGFSVVLLIYTIPAAQVIYARKGFAGAFSKLPFRAAFTGEYLRAFFVVLLAMIVLGIIMFVSNLLLQFTVVGPFFVTAFASFVMTVAVMTIYGEAID